jgi:hypothetical protein
MDDAAQQHLFNYFNFNTVHFVQCLEITNKCTNSYQFHYFTQLLLHVSALVCLPEGALLYLLGYKPVWFCGW